MPEKTDVMFPGHSLTQQGLLSPPGHWCQEVQNEVGEAQGKSVLMPQSTFIILVYGHRVVFG
jgi:hypothetical protein